VIKINDSRLFGINKFNLPSEYNEATTYAFKGYEGSWDDNVISMS